MRLFCERTRGTAMAFQEEDQSVTTYDFKPPDKPFPWGKVLGFLAVLIVIIISVIARSNAVEDNMRDGRYYEVVPARDR